MKFLRLSLCVWLVFISTASWAGRFLPNDIHIVTLKNAAGKEVVLGSVKRAWLRTLTLGTVNSNKKFVLANNIRVRNEKNFFITYNKLPNYRNMPIAVRFDKADRIVDIWILNSEEQDRLMRTNNSQVN